MGKYAATRAFQRDRGRTVDSRSNTFSSVGSYLTEKPTDDDQFMAQTYLYNLDPTGIYRSYLSTRDTMNYWNDYFQNTGLTWNDVKYPTMMSNFGSVGYANVYRSAYTFFSKNISRLYR